MSVRTLSYAVLLSASLVAINAGMLGERNLATAQASTALHYSRGYSVQGSWLCYGWSNGIYHCTQHWVRSGSRFVSLNTPFVPSEGSAGTRTTPTSSGTVAGNQNTSGQPCRETVRWPARITQWTVPLGCYARIYYPNPARYRVRPSYGWCNWWPEVLHPGYAGSTVLHLPGHNQPRVGSVVFFSGGVQGASAAGHYAQVVAIAPGGYWILITEMNFYWRGGGFKRVDYRFIHLGPGVSFRYAA